MRDLKVHFATDDGLVKSVDGLSFTLEKGQTLGIVGESGSGKSVTSLAVMGLHRASRQQRSKVEMSGEIWLDGKELVSADPDEVRRLRGREMAMIFQDPLSALHPYYTVGRRSWRRTASTTTSTRRPRASGRSRCSTGSASRSPTSGSTTIRTSSPAVCASAP